MKKIIFLFSLLATVTSGIAQVKMPAPSPVQTIKQDFALGSMELTYSRPTIKGRTIYGDLVPYGKLWRLGANAATSIRFSDPVMIGGVTLDTGKYVIYAIPNESNWEIIFNKGLKNWGVDGYKESEDVLRFTVKSMRMKDKMESFTMQFADVMPESCELHIMWAKTAVAIPIKADIRSRMRASLDKALQGDKKPNWQAAQYYYEYEKDNAKALQYAKAATSDNDKAFWVWLYRAKIEAEMGDKTAAMASSKKSWELAKEAKNDDYVKMNEELQKKLR